MKATSLYNHYSRNAKESKLYSIFKTIQNNKPNNTILSKQEPLSSVNERNEVGETKQEDSFNIISKSMGYSTHNTFHFNPLGKSVNHKINNVIRKQKDSDKNNSTSKVINFSSINNSFYCSASKRAKQRNNSNYLTMNFSKITKDLLNKKKPSKNKTSFNPIKKPSSNNNNLSKVKCDLYDKFVDEAIKDLSKLKKGKDYSLQLIKLYSKLADKLSEQSRYKKILKPLLNLLKETTIHQIDRTGVNNTNNNTQTNSHNCSISYNNSDCFYFSKQNKQINNNPLVKSIGNNKGNIPQTIITSPVNKNEKAFIEKKEEKNATKPRVSESKLLNRNPANENKLNSWNFDISKPNVTSPNAKNINFQGYQGTNNKQVFNIIKKTTVTSPTNTVEKKIVVSNTNQNSNFKAKKQATIQEKANAISIVNKNYGHIPTGKNTIFTY